MEIYKTIHTPIGDYDIIKVENGYSVNINGQDIYCMFEEDIRHTIDRTIAINLFENIPYNQNYSEEQLQKIFNFITEDFDKITYFSSKIAVGPLKNDIINILNNGNVTDLNKNQESKQLFLKTIREIKDLIENENDYKF